MHYQLNIKILAFDCDGVTIREGTEIKETGNELFVKTAQLDDSITEKFLAVAKVVDAQIEDIKTLQD